MAGITRDPTYLRLTARALGRGPGAGRPSIRQTLLSDTTNRSSHEIGYFSSSPRKHTELFHDHHVLSPNVSKSDEYLKQVTVISYFRAQHNTTREPLASGPLGEEERWARK
ncbi:hypothetical protein EVAR_31215_1 [Eumeta japonica]|uniref:Uncharacterized protein n=1 Tax=Eumeta variegata TaxID=151549 RepID=A0A4C1VWX9_EUMVA|nr:hypothetical protein EVAR_31215_1 [Eumeta japonica]